MKEKCYIVVGSDHYDGGVEIVTVFNDVEDAKRAVSKLNDRKERFCREMRSYAEDRRKTRPKPPRCSYDEFLIIEAVIQ